MITFAFLVHFFVLQTIHTSILMFYYSATSIDVERLFSRGRLILSHVRNRMSAGTTHELLCLNNWSKQGLVKMADLKAAASLPEVAEDDAAEE